MKNLGYATGQFGKNHVGDRNESLPTVNGFDEFFGNLYHLNAEEEPELPDYPKDPAYKAKFGPRGVLQMQGNRQRRSDRRAALRQSRQADDRRHGAAHQEANGNDRRRDRCRGDRLHEAAARGEESRSSVDEHDAHALAHARSGRAPRPYKHGDSEYLDGMIEHDGNIGQMLKGARRHGRRQQHGRRKKLREKKAGAKLREAFPMLNTQPQKESE